VACYSYQSPQKTTFKSQLLSRKHRINLTVFTLTFTILYTYLQYISHLNPQLFKKNKTKRLILISRNKFFKDNKNQVFSNLLMSYLTKSLQTKCEENQQNKALQHLLIAANLSAQAQRLMLTVCHHHMCTTYIRQETKLCYFSGTPK
jgi:hypothetical protein